MKNVKFWNWRIATIAAIAAPLSVLIHELAHVAVLELGGVPAHLRGFSMGMPSNYFWDFQGLENAKLHLSVSNSVFIAASLAGPIVTLGISVLCLLRT